MVRGRDSAAGRGCSASGNRRHCINARDRLVLSPGSGHDPVCTVGGRSWCLLRVIRTSAADSSREAPALGVSAVPRGGAAHDRAAAIRGGREIDIEVDGAICSLGDAPSPGHQRVIAAGTHTYRARTRVGPSRGSRRRRRATASGPPKSDRSDPVRPRSHRDHRRRRRYGRQRFPRAATNPLTWA